MLEFPLQNLRKEPILPTSWFWTSHFLNRERINLFCFKAPGLWSFVTTALGISYSDAWREGCSTRTRRPPRTPSHDGWLTAGTTDAVNLLPVCSQIVAKWYRGYRHCNGEPVARWLCAAFISRPVGLPHFKNFLFHIFKRKNYVMRKKIKWLFNSTFFKEYGYVAAHENHLKSLKKNTNVNF